MTVQALAAAVNPPHDVGIRSDWMSVTDRLGVSYAPDYRAVVETYGFGYFESGTMLFDPRSDRFPLSVDAVLRVMRDPDLRRHPLPLQPYPGPGSRLLPVTSNGSGGYIMAVVVDGDQDDRTFWLADLDVDEFLELPGPFSSLLLRLVQGAPEIDEIWHITGPFHPR